MISMVRLLLFVFLIVACSPNLSVAMRPTATLSLGAQVVAGQQTATAIVASGHMTELEIISATEAASIRQAEMDLSAQQADVDRQNAITVNMIKVWADQTALAVKHEDTNATYAQATAQIYSAYAQATAEIIEANVRREIEAEDHRFDFGTWLMIAGVMIAGAFVAGAFLRVIRSVQIGQQEDKSRELVVREQLAQARIAESTALVADYNAQRAQIAAWNEGREQLADGRILILISNNGIPEPHFIIDEPIALPDAGASRAVINFPQDKKRDDSQVVRKEDIKIDDPVSLQHSLIRFLNATIRVADGGVESKRLVHHSNLPEYNSGSWMRLTDILEYNKLIIKIPKRHSLVNPDSNLHNLGELLTHITNAGIFVPTAPPNGGPPQKPKQAVNTGNTAKTDENRTSGVGG